MDERTYIPDEQEDKKREEEEKDLGISPSILDVQNYFDSPDSLDETKDKGPEPGSIEADSVKDEENEGNKDKEGQETESQEEETPEEPDKEEHPQDEEELFQDRRGRNIYTEEELAGLEEEEPEEEGLEIFIDEEEELKKKEEREAKKRRVDKFREYNRTHSHSAQSPPSDAAGIGHGETGAEGDAFYEERIRHAYGPREEDAGEALEPAGRSDELLIEEGDTSVGPSGMGHRGADTGARRGGYAWNGARPGQAQSISNAEGISIDSNDGDSFYEERIRYAYSPREEDAGEAVEPAGRSEELLIEEGDTSVGPSGMRHRGADTGAGRSGYARNGARPGQAQSISNAEGISIDSNDGDSFYEERIRYAYSPREEDAGEAVEPAGRSEELLIEEGDTSVGPSGMRHRGADTGARRGGYAWNRARPGQAQSISNAEGISVDSNDGDSFYEERIRRTYSPSDSGDPPLPSGEKRSASIPVVEDKEASFIPRAGMASKKAGAGYIRPVHTKGTKDAAGIGNTARDITTSKADGISMPQDGTSANVPAGTRYGYRHGTDSRHSAGGPEANAELFRPEGTKRSKPRRVAAGAAGKNAGINGAKKKNVPAGSLKSITMDDAPSEGLAKDTPAQAEAARRDKPVILGGKGKSVLAPENSKEAGIQSLSNGKAARLRPAGKPGAVNMGRSSEKISPASGRAAVLGQGEKPGTIKTAGTISKESVEKTGKSIPDTAANAKNRAASIAPGPSARKPCAGKGIITDAHVTGIVKDWEKEAGAGGRKIAPGAVKTAGIYSGYMAPAAASAAGAVGKGMAAAGSTAGAISPGAGILPPEDSKKKKEEKNEIDGSSALKSASGTAKAKGETGPAEAGIKDGIIVKHRSVDERLGGSKKTASTNTATDAAGRQESKGLIRASSPFDTGRDSKIIAGNAMDREGGKGPITRSVEKSRKAAELLRRYQAAHAAQATPMGASSPAASAGGGAKLKILFQALSKKAVAMLLTSTITAGAIAGGMGMANRRTIKGDDNDWMPVQAHVMTTDAMATGNTEDGTETGTASPQRPSGTGTPANNTNTTPNTANTASGDNKTGNISSRIVTTDNASNGNSASNNANASAAGAGTPERGIPLTQDALEKMFTRMQAYGVLSPMTNYSSTTITGGAARQNPNAQSLIEYAKSWVGKMTYERGCNDKLRVGGKSDCSWFVYHCLMDTGVLPKGTHFIHADEWGEDASKYPGGVHIGKDLSKAQPGDIICEKSLPHVGIYIGNGEYVECSGHSNAVKIGKPEKNKISNIVRFSGTAVSSGGSLTEPTTSRYGFTEATEAIVEAHMTDFDYNNFESFMREHGGGANYVRSLGGVFEKYCGVKTEVQSAGQFQEVAEYVMGLMTIWGPDYHGGGGDHKFNGNHGKGDQYGRFYHGSKIHHWKFGFDIEKVYFRDKEHIMTDCGCGCSYIMYKAGILHEKQYAGQDEKSEARHRIDVSRGGAIITRKEDLQVGDIVQMSKTKHEKGWGHVCVVGEVYPDGTVITYDTGNRYVNSGNFKKIFNPDSDGDFSGDYKGYHSWFGQRIRALDQSDAQTFGYYLSGPAVENLKEIRINSVKVDGKTKNRNKFSYNTLGDYSKHGKIVSAVNVNFTFVDKNRNDIAGTVLANGNQNDAAKAKKEADKIIKAAEKHKHVSFSPGGNDWKTGMDATHYVYKILKEAGLYSGKERTVSGWRLAGKKVDKLENAQKGDIIVYQNHVAIYDGSGKIYECSAKTGGASHSRKAGDPGKIISIRRLTDDISGSSAKATGTTPGAGTSDGTAPSASPGRGGFTIKIPPGLGATHTYMGWQCITAPSSNQYKLRSEAGMNFDSEGFGVIKGRYVIACTTTYGNVGDCVDFYKKNGQVIHGVIGDIKSQHDAGCTKWGHHNGRNVIEFVVDKNKWYSNGAGSHVNPGNPSCHPEWASETVKAVNLGSWKNNAAVEHPTSMASPSDLSFTAGRGRSNEEPLYLAMQILSMTPTGANSCKNPVNMDQYDRYCFDILDWAVTESYGADVRYTSIGDFYQCDITVDICCDPAKLQKNDSNFKWWDYKHDNGDPQVKSYMDLPRDVYCDVFNVDVYRLLSANISPFSGNEEVVYEFFRSKGLGPAQIAAIMGNIKGESNFNPNAVNASSGASGLFQWRGGRLDALKRMAEARGRDWTDIQTQLDYAWKEIQGSGWNGNDSAKNLFMSSTNTRQAAMIFCTYFERTGDPADATKRAGYAEKYYNTIMSAMNPQSTSGTATGGGGTDYIQWAMKTAADNSHGYSQARRNGNPDYDCSSFVYYALKSCGYNVGNTAFTTFSMPNILPKAGFSHVTIHSVKDMQPGDILLRNDPGKEHTEIYTGNGKSVGAHQDLDGKPGDSSGQEVSEAGCGSDWREAYRPNSAPSGTAGGKDVVSLLEKWKKEGGGHSQVMENYNKYASKYNVSRIDGSSQWNSETASAAYAALGLADTIGGMSANGGSYESKAKRIGAWVSDKNYKPKRNDIIITHKGADDAQHRYTAVVISCDGNKIKCIAGGGSSIHTQTITVGANEISGYVVPRGEAASSNAGGYGQPDTYYQPQRGWYRPTKGSWHPPVVPATPSPAPPSSGEPTDNDWGVYIGKEFHNDISQLRGKRQVVIEGQDQSRKEIDRIKSSGAKVYSYLSIGSLEDYRPYYKKFNKKKFKLGHYENWDDEQWVDTSQKEWRDYVVDHIAESLKKKGIDSLWLDNTDVYEMYHHEKIYKGLLDIVTRLKAKGFTLMYNGGDKFVSRLIKEGRTNLVDGVMQEEVYSKIVDYDNDKFSKQDSDDQKAHEAYLDRCKAAGIPVACLEYTRDPSLIKKIKKKCKERGYEYYISGRVNLD